MGFELPIYLLIVALLLTFLDISLGMGYGTTIAPILIIAGYDPLEVVPAVLLTSAFFGILAGLFHHKFKNVNLSPGEPDFKRMLVLTGLGTLGVIAAGFIAIEIPEIALESYIGLLIIAIGAIIVIRRNQEYKWTWKKFIGYGLLASFNKGISGGGFGPVIVGGQMLSGVGSKGAIGVAAISEGLISLIGAGLFFIFGNGSTINWPLIISLLVGSIAAVPLGTYAVKIFDAKRLKIYFAGFSIALGLAMIGRIIIIDLIIK